MNTATLNPIKVEYIRWNDNLSEVKRFCGDQCVITYETCHIDDYWLLKLYSPFTKKFETVPLHNYIVKYDDEFISVDPFLFKELFTVNSLESKEENIEPENITLENIEPKNIELENITHEILDPKNIDILLKMSNKC